MMRKTDSVDVRAFLEERGFPSARELMDSLREETMLKHFDAEELNKTNQLFYCFVCSLKSERVPYFISQQDFNQLRRAAHSESRLRELQTEIIQVKYYPYKDEAEYVALCSDDKRTYFSGTGTHTRRHFISRAGTRRLLK